MVANAWALQIVASHQGLFLTGGGPMSISLCMFALRPSSLQGLEGCRSGLWVWGVAA